MSFRRRSAFLKSAICALAGTTALSACSAVPSSGPSREAVVYAGAQQTPPYLLVRLSDFVIQKLLRFPGPSLYGKFGDYRGSLEQRVGIGDTVIVTIFEAAGGGLFSQPVADPKQTGSHSAVLPPQIVQRDGAITVPYAGRVPVDGRTTHQIERDIVGKLTGKAIEPQVVVALSNNISSSVTVGGEGVGGTLGSTAAAGTVAPGLSGLRIPLSAAGDRLLDVIANAGGLKTPAHETFLELTRGGRTVRVPFQTLLNDPKENIFARPDDTLTVVRYPLTFTAVGATTSNAVVPFSAVGINLAEAVGKATGLTDGRADPEGVFVFRFEPASVVRDYPGPDPATGSAQSRPDRLHREHARPAFAVHGAQVFDARQGHHLRVELAVCRDRQGHHGLQRVPGSGAERRRSRPDHRRRDSQHQQPDDTRWFGIEFGQQFQRSGRGSGNAGCSTMMLARCACLRRVRR